MKRFPVLICMAAMLLAYGSSLAQLSGNYDVGGGNNDYATPVDAAAALAASGVSGPTTFNIYNGTYSGQINLPGTIPGLGAGNPVTFQNAAGQSPVIVSPAGHGFYLTGADYITIQGLTITSCYYNCIYNYYSGTDSSKNNTFRGNHIYTVGAAGNYSGIQLYYSADCQILENRIEGDYYGIYVYFSNRNLVANNIILNVGYYGINHWYGNYNNYYYNTVYTGTGSAFILYNGSYNNLRNNILYQWGSGSSLSALTVFGSPATYFNTSNYNDLYAPSAYVGYYGGYLQTLVQWRTSTGLDASSISGNPVFVNASGGDFHIKTYLSSPVEAAGTPVALVTTDYDNDLRDVSTPDIGADEFTYAPYSYCLEMTPVTATGSVAPGQDSNYSFTIWNCGTVSDVYNLSAVVSSGESWTHQVMDSVGPVVIDSLAVASGGTGTFVVRVTPGEGALPGLTSIGRIIAASRYGSFRNIFSDTSWTTTSNIMGGAYDVGGGAMHYATPVAAATALAAHGVGAPTVFNIYTGTYNGQVNLPAIIGVSATNTVTFQAALGNTPAITSTAGYGFNLTGADYITIRNLDIANCLYDGIYSYYSGSDSSKFNHFIENHIHNVGTAGNYAGIYCIMPLITRYCRMRLKATTAGFISPTQTAIPSPTT